MPTIKWLPGAQDDLQRLYDFIMPHSEDAAISAIETILAGVDYIGEFPEAGRPWDYDTAYRKWVVRFGAKGYVIRYRLYEENIIIVRVWHSLEDQ